MTPTQATLLALLRALDDKQPGNWWRPMDVGGHKNTGHSASLRRMVRNYGWIELRERQGIALVRAHNEYRITDAGKRALVNHQTTLGRTPEIIIKGIDG